MTTEYIEKVTAKEKMIKELLETNNKIAERVAKLTLKNHHREIGYSYQCKTCNHKEVDKIEDLYEAGHSYQYIIDTLDLDLSVMSLSRHFKNHYPKRIRYKLEKKKEMLETVLDVLESHPYLDNYFNECSYEELEEFTTTNGYCTSCNMLCQYIPAKQIANIYIMQDVFNYQLEKLKHKGNGYYLPSYDTPNYEAIEILEKKINCINCKDTYKNTETIEVLEEIILKLLNVDTLKTPNLLTLLTIKYNDSIEALVNDLKAVAEANSK